MVNEKDLLASIAKICPECYGIVAKAVQGMPNEGWIPVTKKLPNIGELVLVQFNDTRSDIMIAELAKYEVDDDRWELMWSTQEMSIEYDLEDVIAWQTLPDVYKGGMKMRAVVEADGIKPCPICGKSNNLQVTDMAQYNQTYVEDGYGLIHLECGTCSLQLWSHKCNERPYSKHLAWMPRRWNKMWERKNETD